jgi:hypothetical protein
MTEQLLRWASTAAFLTVAGYCVARLVAAARVPAEYRGHHRAVDVAHVLMGVGMAAMASPVGGPLPMAAWQTVFLLMTVWFVGSWVAERRGERSGPVGWHGGGLHHAVAAVAMVYMLTAMPHGGHHRSAPWLAGWTDGGVAGMALPLVGWVLAGYFLVTATLFVVRTRWRTPVLSGSAPLPARLPALLTAPRVMASCQAAMALGNGYLLLAML